MWIQSPYCAATSCCPTASAKHTAPETRHRASSCDNKTGGHCTQTRSLDDSAGWLIWPEYAGSACTTSTTPTPRYCWIGHHTEDRQRPHRPLRPQRDLSGLRTTIHRSRPLFCRAAVFVDCAFTIALSYSSFMIDTNFCMRGRWRATSTQQGKAIGHHRRPSSLAKVEAKCSVCNVFPALLLFRKRNSRTTST